MSFYGVDDEVASPLFDIPCFQYGIESPILAAARPFYEEGGYQPGMVVLPSTAMLKANTPIGLNAYQQVEDRTQVPPGSWLLGFSGHSVQPEGFRFTIFDEGRKQHALAEQWLQNFTDAEDSTDADVLPILLPEPYYIVPSGWLQLRLVNSSPSSNDCQLMLWFALPKARAMQL